METIQNKQIHIVGGGTFEPVHSHLALAAPAFGTTARQLGELCTELIPSMDTNVHLTKMADPRSELCTASDLRELAHQLVGDYATKMVFWSPMIADFRGRLQSAIDPRSGKLDSTQVQGLTLVPNEKIVPIFRKESIDGREPRKDIFLAAFKTTVGAPPDIQKRIAQEFMKKSGANLVLANDTKTRLNMVVVPEESAYAETTDRTAALRELVNIAFWRSQMTFTRSTVVAGESVPWNSEQVWPALRDVVNHCIARGAYKPIDNKTAGHFAAKIGPNTFLTSIRKSNFNHIDEVGLVKVETDGEDHVIAYGRKPSVGGQSQRIIFEQHPDKDCIAHAHIPLRADAPDNIPVVSQREYECGSHQCGENTSRGLGKFENGEIEAVMLDNHGPNIVFHHSIDPQKVINFIERNFDLSSKTGGYVPDAA
jgi:hypothetical protein